MEKLMQGDERGSETPWRIRTGDGRIEVVHAWAVWLGPGGTLVLKGGEQGHTVVSTYGPTGWTHIEMEAQN